MFLVISKGTSLNSLDIFRDEPLFHLGDISSHWQEVSDVTTIVPAKLALEKVQFSPRSSKPDFGLQGDRLRCLRELTGKLYCEMSKLKPNDFSVHFNFLKAYTSYVTNAERSTVDEIAKCLNDVIAIAKNNITI